MDVIIVEKRTTRQHHYTVLVPPTYVLHMLHKISPSLCVISFKDWCLKKLDVSLCCNQPCAKLMLAAKSRERLSLVTMYVKRFLGYYPKVKILLMPVL